MANALVGLLAAYSLCCTSAEKHDEAYWFQMQAKADAHEVDTFRGKDFNNHSHYFLPTQERRAYRYVEQSKKWVRTIRAATQSQRQDDEDGDDSGADTFMYEWLVSNHILAATEMAPEVAGVWAGAAEVGLQVFLMLGEESQEFPPHRVAFMISKACHFTGTHLGIKALGTRFQKTLQGSQHGDEFENRIRTLAQGRCLNVKPGHGQAAQPVHAYSIENPPKSAPKCAADSEAVTRPDGKTFCVPLLQYTQLELWPTRMPLPMLPSQAIPSSWRS